MMRIASWLVLVVLLTGLTTLGAAPSTEPAAHVDHKSLVRLAWQLTVPTGTFPGRTVFEALDLLHPLTVHHVELTPGQPLSPDHRDVLVRHDMPASQLAELQAKLKATHLDVVSYGPVDLGADEATDRAIFAFANQLKAKVVVATPPAASLERLDRLATEFGIKLAIPNGPARAGYRTSADLKTAATGRSPWVGSADVLGAWSAAGDDVVSATRVLQDHITEVRIDTTAGNRPALAELAQHGFKGVFVVDPGQTDVAGLVAAINVFSSDVTAVVGQATAK